LTHLEQQDFFFLYEAPVTKSISFFVISEKNDESFRTFSAVPGGAGRVRRISDDAPFRVGKATPFNNSTEPECRVAAGAVGIGGEQAWSSWGPPAQGFE
jgi:hypothetical protein